MTRRLPEPPGRVVRLPRLKDPHCPGVFRGDLLLANMLRCRPITRLGRGQNHTRSTIAII